MSMKTATSLKKLGSLLVDVGIMNQEQLNEALEIQKRSGGKLGQILLQLGYVTEEVLLTFLGKQVGMQFISLQEFGNIPDDVIHAVPESIVRHQTLIPVAKKNNVLVVAMSDPFNVFAVDDLKVMTGYNIDIVIAPAKEIKDSIEKYYGAKDTMHDVLKELETLEAEDDLELVKEKDAGSDIVALEQQGEEAPVIKLVNYILSSAVRMRASDIHIEPYEKILRVRYRVDGVLHEQQAPPKKMQNAMVSRIKIMAKLDISEHRLPQDGRIKIKVMGREIDLRVSILPSAFGEKVVMRLLDSSALAVDINKIGFEPETLALFQKNIHSPHGVILVTGPTGSGKTTTLYSALTTLNQPDINIITIEDPVEYVMEGINQVHARPDIGLTFAAGLRSFLRQDPDIIMVGEIRDTETAQIAVNAALTGHLVLASLHTNDAPGAITRLDNMGVEPFLTSSTILMVVAQRLIRMICKHCKEAYEIDSEQLVPLGINPEQLKGTKKVVLYRGRGCDQCSKGYHGRTGVYSIMEMNDEIRALMLKHSASDAIRDAAIRNGMMSLRQSGLRKMLNGITTVEEVLRVTTGD
jgi:type IV pilus assembly protein PilB